MKNSINNSTKVNNMDNNKIVKDSNNEIAIKKQKQIDNVLR